MSVHRKAHNNAPDAIVFAIKKVSSFDSKINGFSSRFLNFSDLAKGVCPFFIDMTENMQKPLGAAEEKEGKCVRRRRCVADVCAPRKDAIEINTGDNRKKLIIIYKTE